MMDDPIDRNELAALYLSEPVKAHAILFGPDNNARSAPAHAEVIRLFHGPDANVVLLAFRGFAKSTLAERAIALLAASGVSQNTVIVGESFPRAVERLHSIRRILERNERLRYLFGATPDEIEGDIWRETKIVLSSGAVVWALGSGQAVRGAKHGVSRPEFVFVDDLESAETVATPDARRKLSDFFWGDLIPAMARDARVRVAATPLDPDSLAVNLAKHKDYKTLTVPIEYIDEQGQRCSSWPDAWPLDKIDKRKDELVRAGKQKSWAMEYMVIAVDPLSKLFTKEQLRFSQHTHSWQPVYVAYDPARTTKKGSATTGIVAGSFVGRKLIVWEARGPRFSPSEIIADMFEVEARYQPIAIGVEKTGLEDFLIEPLRHEQIKRSKLLPLADLKPPRGKERFIERLQPLMAAGDIVFAGTEPDFVEAIDQFLSFPTGFLDIPNALAYLTEMRQGQPVFEEARETHLFDGDLPIQGTATLALHAGPHGTAAVLFDYKGGVLFIYRDWLVDALPAASSCAIVEEARLLSPRQPQIIVPPYHFDQRNSFGLIASLKGYGSAPRKGGAPERGRAFLRELLKGEMRGGPRLLIGDGATWMRRALFGGLVRLDGAKEDKPGLYATLTHALEAALAPGASLSADTRQRMDRTPDGTPYPSALVHYS